MPDVNYDTRFFVEHYYARDPDSSELTQREIRREKAKIVSAIVIHEVYRLTLQTEGRQVARLRTELIRKDFKVIDVDSSIAAASAELRQKYAMPMANSIIAATSILRKSVCVTDDLHITKVREIDARWV